MKEVRGGRCEVRGVSCESRAMSLSTLSRILFIYLSLSLILILSLSSCKQANPRTVKLWVEMSDTMVQRMINEQQPVMDSLCLKKTDSLFRIAYDSIYLKRLAEIRKLIDSSHHDEFPVR